MTKTFEELGLSAQLTKALTENGFKAPFPIQETAIPLILHGKDVVGQAHTGTGKTASLWPTHIATDQTRRPGAGLDTCSDKRTCGAGDR